MKKILSHYVKLSFLIFLLQFIFLQISFLSFQLVMAMSEVGSPHRELPSNSQYDDYINALPKGSGLQRDISGEAVWSLSSCKVG